MILQSSPYYYPSISGLVCNLHGVDHPDTWAPPDSWGHEYSCKCPEWSRCNEIPRSPRLYRISPACEDAPSPAWSYTRSNYHTEVITLVETTPISDCYLSDHYKVLCNLVLRKPAFSVKEVSYRKVKAIDINAFRKIYSNLTYCVARHHGNWTILFPAIIPFVLVRWISTLLLSRKPLPYGHAHPGLMTPSRQRRENAAAMWAHLESQWPWIR